MLKTRVTLGISSSALLLAFGACSTGDGFTTGTSGGGSHSTLGRATSSGSSGAASSSAATSSASSSSASSGSSGGAGCMPDAGDAGPTEPTATDLQPCSADSQCSCLERCVQDSAIGKSLCELPCATQADCVDPTQPQAVCRGGYCGFNVCGQGFQGAAPGSFGAPCNVADAGDGNCQPVQTTINGTTQLVGYCLPTGQLGPGAPNCVNDLLGPMDQCAPGLVCPYQYGSYGCSPACAMVGSSTLCKTGQVCLALFPNETTVGVCGVCQPAGAYCLVASDCCNTQCIPDAGFSNCFLQPVGDGG